MVTVHARHPSCDVAFVSWAGLTGVQEGYLAKHAVSEEDRMAAAQGDNADQDGPLDPMQGLEGLDVAGPRPA